MSLVVHHIEHVRPSALPKLAICPRYVGSSSAGQYAERGNKLDNAFRLLFSGDPSALEGCDAEEQASLAWAVAVARLLAGGREILTEKAACKVDIPGFFNPGEADAVVPDRHRSMDLKSGILRNYREQMAAYAYGFMSQHFASEWTCSLIFLDLRQVEHIHFTFDEAKGIVEKVIADYRDPESVATPGEACGWCALKEVCQARLNLAAESLAGLHLREGFEAIKADPEKLANFLVGCKALKDYYEEARAHGKTIFEAGRSVPGYKLQTRKGNEYVAPGDVAAAFPDLKPAELAQLYGNLTGTAFRQAWAERHGTTEIPANVIQAAQASTFITKAA